MKSETITRLAARYLMLPLVALAQTGCASGADIDVCAGVDQTLFQGSSLASRMHRFEAMPVESQYQAYICGNQKVHPPAVYLAAPLAAHGQLAVEYLINKLKDAADDLTIRDIAAVFAEMSRSGTYSVGKNKRVTDLLRLKISGMKSPGWQQATLEMLRDIEART